MGGIKNVINSNELSVAKFKFVVIGLPPILFLEVKGLEKETEEAILPDQTTVSGGRTKAGSFTAKVPAHHLVEIAALEMWHEQGIDPVSPNYKKSATLMFLSKDNSAFKMWNVKGCWCKKEKVPDGDLKDQGNEAEIEYTFAFDDIKASAI